MSLLTAMVVDDEPLARDYLVSVLDQLDGVEVVAQCGSGREALKKVPLLNPDILFLDIEMPGINGFDVVKGLQPETLPLVVFATAYQEYAVQAFEVQAIDYVLKPLEPERVHQAVERARQRQLNDVAVADKSSLINVVEQLQEGGAEAKTAEFSADYQKLAVKDHDEIILVPFADIDWIDAAGDYMCVHVGDVTHVLRCTMKELERKVSGSSLARVHRSTLVNLDKVQSISSLAKGESLLHLNEGVALKVSRGYRKNIVTIKS